MTGHCSLTEFVKAISVAGLCGFRLLVLVTGVHMRKP